MNIQRNSAGNGILAFAIALSIITFLLVGWLWLSDSKLSRSGADEQAAASREETPNPAEPAPAASAGSPPAKQAEQRPARADTARRRMKLEDLDTRAAVAAAPDTAKAAALEALKAKLPRVEVRMNPITGAPDYIMAAGKFLAPAGDPAGDGYAPVRQFVNENAALFGHDATAINDSRVTRDDVTAHNGMRTVVWQQQVDGVPVYNTILKANLTKDGALVTMGSHFMSDAMAATQMDAAQRTALIAQPPVDVKKALSLAAANLGDAVAPEQAQEASQPEGAERRQRFTAPRLSDTFAQLAWLPVGKDSAKLTWDVTLTSLKQNEMFRVLVDAKTGEILMRTSLTSDISNASYRVYANGTTQKPFDSPTPMLPGTPTPSGAQPAEVPRQLVTLQAQNLTASPNGWINDGVTETLGNNVDAHTDTDANNAPDLPRPTSATRVFDFPMSLTQEPGTYKDASITQLFYLCNWMHDQLYALGFTESAGNFQTDNFGRGGLGNDALNADAQDGSGTNNANMSVPFDGSPPRMQMYIYTGPTPDRDSGFDAVIVLHEYTHGLSNRLVGGGVSMSALASRGMGEGWSDFYGIALLSDPTSDPNAVYPANAYGSLNLFGTGMTTNHYYGNRRYPYSTDMTKNPLTFRDIDPTQASPHTGIPLSPRYVSSNSNPSQVHAQGEVWCMALWECRANLIAKHGPAGAQMILQLVTDGMKLAPANPNFLQARDGIIQADLVSSGGVNLLELWAGFAKRGMGHSATAPASSTTTGVVEAFDLPVGLSVTRLSVTPFATLTAAGPAGGPFTPALRSYTLTNTGFTSALTWTASTSVPWMSVSPAGGILAPGASTTATMAFNSAASSLASGTYGGSVIFTDVTNAKVLSPGVTLMPGAGPAPGLTVIVPDSLPEGAFLIVGAGVVTLGTAQAADVIVSLTSSNPGRVSVPASVTVPAGNVYAPFNLMVGDDFTIDGPQAVVVTGSASGFPTGAGVITVQDNDGTGTLSLSAPASVTEGVGNVPATLTLSVAPGAPMTVTLSSSDTTEIVVPRAVVIPAGQTSITFPITVVNDFQIDGTQSATITAQVAGWTAGGASISVLEILHHFTVSTVASPQIRGAPFPVTFTAKDVNDVTITNFTGALTPSAIGSGGAVTITPTTVSGFANGVRTLNVTANTFSTNVTLTIDAGSGQIWTSNAFDVTVGPVHHFAWNAVASPQTAGTPFSATITAQDAGNNTVTSFGGSAGLRARPPSLSIGTGTATTMQLPLNNYFHDQRSQCIYLQSEVGRAATITGLALNVTLVPGQTVNNWTIRMKHTPLANYDTTAAWEGTGWTTVYQANETFSTGLVTFNFTTPFAYDGVSNLMVDFSFNNSSSSTWGGVEFTTTSPARTINEYTNSGFGDPLVWTGTGSPTPFSSTILPNIKLVRTVDWLVAPAATGNFTGGVWTGNVVALQGATPMVLQAYDGAGHTGDSNPFTVNGFAGPEISVEQPALTGLTDGAATVDFGSAGVGRDVPGKIFVIRNGGSQVLTIAGITGDGPDIARFAFPSLSGVAIQPGASFSFAVQFSAASAGLKTAAIHIASNDANENPFDIALTGTGYTLRTIGPDAFGYIGTNGGTFPYTDISATGTVILDGADDSLVNVPLGFNFGYYGTPYSSVYVSSNGLLTFGAGNSASGNTALTTSSVGQPAIAVLWDNWVTNASASDKAYHATSGAVGNRVFTVQWNLTPFGGGGEVIFQCQLLEATGQVLMHYLDVQTGTGASNGALSTIGIQDAGGNANGRVLQWSFNTASVYDGTSIAFSPTGPEILVEQPAGTGLADGESSRDFGLATLGTSTALTFTVGNNGDKNLILLGVSKDGANDSDFILGPLGATTLGPGEATTFTVTFTPGAAGARNATLRIASNDPDETSFDISLTGTGRTRLEGWRLTHFGSSANSGDGADARDFEFDGMTNFLEFCMNTHPKQPSRPSQSLVRNGGNLEFTYTRAKAAVLDGVVFAVKWTDTLTPASWSSAGVSQSIPSDDGIEQVVKVTLPAGPNGQRFVRLEVTGN